MIRNKILKEILSDKELMDKYSIREKDLENITISQNHTKDIVTVLSTIITENDNHLSGQMIYKRIKNIHKL